MGTARTAHVRAAQAQCRVVRAFVLAVVSYTPRAEACRSNSGKGALVNVSW
jgi:hypothetical protein